MPSPKVMAGLPDLHIEYGVAVWDKKRIRKEHGDDHYFVSKRARTYGVFDGVSGSDKKHGQGAAERAANNMCFESYQEAKRLSSRKLDKPISPAQLIVRAHTKLVDAKKEYGSTTACVACLHKIKGEKDKAVLSVGNLGDCGVAVIRPSLEYASRSRSKSKSGSASSASRSRSRSRSASRSRSRSRSPSSGSGSGSAKTASSEIGAALTFKTTPMRYDDGMAHPHILNIHTKDIGTKIDRTTHIVQEGDFLIMGSDGLWDNVSYKNILHQVLKRHDKSPHLIARILARLAVMGRKRDDITVLVGRFIKVKDESEK